ncbi:unnamed protein product [Cylicostephanus goldi]|uniref:Uncharacterized protein n=1 Tax=Cylicostephanus goldi TaxID=71465 RepID=A0A3P6QWI4_CYLGO|nr:unnamed protein product [Cylicostephanus goldi]
MCVCGKHEVPPPKKPLTPAEIESLPRFKGVKQVSLRGKHDVLVYSIPGTENAYVFCHGHTNARYQVFQCVYCWKYGAKTSIRVIGDEFLEDPCKIDHICSPVNEMEDRVERLTHKVLQTQESSGRILPIHLGAESLLAYENGIAEEYEEEEMGLGASFQSERIRRVELLE